MHTKGRLVLAVFIFILTGCKWYDQSGPVTASNGLSCQGYTRQEFLKRGEGGYRLFIREEGAECSYICPDGTVRQPELSEKFSTTSPLFSASKEELDAQFCGMLSQPVPTQTPAAATVSPTPPASPTAQASPTIQTVPATEISPAAQSPLLTGQVTMCDTGSKLISFRIAPPPPDLTGKTLEVRIADQQTVCAINPTNPSLLTCTIPASTVFPARVVVSVDGAMVNDFIHDGVGCAEITTPVATPTP